MGTIISEIWTRERTAASWGVEDAAVYNLQENVLEKIFDILRERGIIQINNGERTSFKLSRIIPEGREILVEEIIRATIKKALNVE